MTVKSAQQLSGLFATLSATGALTASTGAPVGALYVDGTVNGAGVTITGGNPYKWTVTLPALTAGQVVSVYITATVSAIATGGVVFEDVSDTKRLSDIAIDASGYVTAASVEGDITGNINGDIIGSVDGVNGDVTGNVNGKVLGGGVGVISATGVQAQIPTDGIGSAQLAATAAQEIADQVWDEALAGHALVGSTGEALTTAASASGATPASLWAYGTRTLTQSAAQIAAAVNGSDIVVLRGDTVTIALTGIGALTGYVSLDFTIKADVGDLDTAALIRVRKNASGLTDGLITLNGATATTAAQANIAINDAGLGNITITLTDDCTAQLTPRRGLVYDVQMITATATKTMTEGDATITGDVTRTLV